MKIRANCKKCCNRHSKKFRETHGDKIKERLRDNIQWLENLKLSLGCRECGYSSHPAALEFHHRDPAIKIANVTHLRDCSRQRILEEIAKCDVLCANCHAILHSLSR